MPRPHRRQVIPIPPGRTIPHMGWNYVQTPANMRLMQGLAPGKHFAFVHSYYADVTDPAAIVAPVEYEGLKMAAAIEKGNLFGCQFHPEKSGDDGLHMLRNFVKSAARQPHADQTHHPLSGRQRQSRRQRRQLPQPPRRRRPRRAGRPLQRQGADELVFLDITATIRSKKTIVDISRTRRRNVFIPFTVGGGISTADQIGLLLRSGADKCSINTAAVQNPT
jgi:hypothetical protein